MQADYGCSYPVENRSIMDLISVLAENHSKLIDYEKLQRKLS
jgi:hypothetical protein